jgi:hypothetical protein
MTKPVTITEAEIQRVVSAFEKTGHKLKTLRLKLREGIVEIEADNGVTLSPEPDAKSKWADD